MLLALAVASSRGCYLIANLQANLTQFLDYVTRRDVNAIIVLISVQYVLIDNIYGAMQA